MKKLLIKSSFPMFALMLAVGGAFASIESKPEVHGGEMTNVLGHNPMANCQDTQKECTPENTGTICTDAGVSLKDPTCSFFVYEIL